MKYCQNPRCHYYDTDDRLKGSGENKTYQTRKRSKFYYGSGNFCTLNCQNDWFEVYGSRAVDYFGILFLCGMRAEKWQDKLYRFGDTFLRGMLAEKLA